MMSPGVRQIANRMIRIGLPVAIVVAGFGGFLYLGRHRSPQARQLVEETAVPVATAVAQLHEGPFQIDVDGVVTPYREIQLAAQVDGRIVFKSPDCRAGRYAPRDTLLLRIDPQDYQLEVSRLTEELRQAEVSLAELDKEVENNEALLALAEQQQRLQHDEFDRQKRLRERGVISESELDQAQQAVLQADNGVVVLKNQLELLATRRARLQSVQQRVAVQLQEAQLRLARTEIRTPKETDVVIVQDNVEEGDLVRVGSPLVTLEDTSRVEVKCQLRMDQLCWLWCGMPAQAGSGDFSLPNAYQVPNTPATVIFQTDSLRCFWEGRLWRYDGIGVNQTTRTVPCRVLVERPRQVRVESTTGDLRRSGPPALVRGMYVRVRLHAQPAVTLLDIPESAIQPGNWVWRFVPEGPEHAGERPFDALPNAAADNLTAAAPNRSGEKGVIGRVQRVDVQVVDVVEQERLFVVTPQAELLIDGEQIQVSNGQVVRGGSNGEPVVLEGERLHVVEGGQRLVVDGRRYKIVAGLPVRSDPEGEVPLYVEQVVLPFPGDVVRRLVRTAIVYVPDGSLSAGDRVVVTPIAAAKGMILQEQVAR